MDDFTKGLLKGIGIIVGTGIATAVLGPGGAAIAAALGAGASGN